MEQVFVSDLVSERFAQLLARPLRTRMSGHIAVDQPTTVMLNDDEHVQNS